MQTTIEFLDACKAAQGLTSDYKLAKFLGVTQQSVNNYRQGKSFLCDETAIKVADCLGIYPALVLANIHAERAKGEVEKRAWQDLVKRLGGTAAAMLLAILAFPSPDVYASGLNIHREYVYYVKSMKL